MEECGCKYVDKGLKYAQVINPEALYYKISKSFHQSWLPYILQEHGVHFVVFCGVMR
jgi:hypothetical protein